MQDVVEGIVDFSNWLWGIPMLGIIVGGSLIMTFVLDFFQFRYFGYIIKQTFSYSLWWTWSGILDVDNGLAR